MIGSKNFTESIILSEIIAQHLEAAGYRVDRRFNLGGTFVCHQALINGQIDLYVEYTGTAHAAILELPTDPAAETVRAVVDSIYRARWEVTWLEPLGFDNTFAMLVRAADARRLGLQRFSDVAPHAASWRPGFGYEFAERADGYRGLAAAYGFRFGRQPAVMELGLTYRALADGQVDVIAGNSTDGQIDALDLVHLDDDRGYFPSYEAVPVARLALFQRVPDVRPLLARLAGTIPDSLIRHLNYLVDVERRSIKDVAAEFLAVESPADSGAISR